MDRRVLLSLTGSVAVGALVRSPRTSFANSEQSAGAAQTQAIVRAAAAFLDTLNLEQRAAVQFPFTVQPKATAAHFKGGRFGNVDMVGEQYGRAMWSNYPVSDVPRPGLRLGAMNEGQRYAVMAMLRVLLSDRGYRKVLDIMGSDQALADGGTLYASGRDAYTLALFGAPSTSSLWMVQFGGHHLALNVTLMGEHGVLAPVLTGCLPAIYQESGKTVRALAAENDKAFALLDALTEAQRTSATIDYPVSDLALGPGRDGVSLPAVGVKASTLNQQQRDMLFDLILEWAGILNDAHVEPRLGEIKNSLSDTFFAWSGPETHQPDRNGASYFRVQGPTLFIEFSPQQPGGDLTMHTHTIYRDPRNAYGRALA